MKASSKKVLSALLALVMVVSMLSMSALAVESSYSLTPYDSNVTALTLSGVNVNSYTVVSEPMSEGSTNIRTTYNIVLSADTASDATVTINFTPASGNVVAPVPPNGQPNPWVGIINANATNTYTSTLEDGVGTRTAYVHKNFPTVYGSCDTYIFNFTVGTYKNPVSTDSGVNVRFGDPAYPNTEPECYMSLTGSGNAYTANYAGPKANYYPDVLSMSITGSGIDKLYAGGGAKILTYDTEGTKTEHDDITPDTNINNGKKSTIYTVQIGATTGSTITVKDASGSTTATITFLAPQAATEAGGTAPKYVNGYLPLGQYATGASWGSIFTDYNNVTGVATTGAATKITSGLASTGISLGAPGGYVQFEFENNVLNSASNKYGIDFVIYGNPFNGNPEAGSVKVSQDGNTWYELAGSRYYNSETMQNASITYTLKSNGVYYSLNGGTSVLFKASTGWWPADDEGYADVDGVGAVFKGGKTVTGVTRGTDSEGNPTITYSGVTLVKDSDITDDYIFGYADIRHVGSTKDGTACNPYASLPSGATSSDIGGDGFDISWAVNPDGTPKALDYIKYVRIYTSAALDPNNLTALPTPNIFGETSTEVCGVFVAKESGSGSAVAPTITADGSAFEDCGLDSQTTSVSDNQQIITVNDVSSLGSFTLGVSGGTYVYINGVSISSTSVSVSSGETKVFQIINQSGTAEPFVTLLKLVG